MPARSQILLTHVGCAVTCSSVPAVPSLFDIVSTVSGPQSVYWGFRAPSTAKAGGKIANICNPGDAVCVDMSSDAITGNMVVTTVGGVTCTSVSPNCTVKTLYEQETCGSTCNMTMATAATRPLFIPACTSHNHPCMTCSFASGRYLQSAGSIPNIAQPFSQASFAMNTNSAAAGIIVGGANSGSFGSEEFFNGSNTFAIYSGTTVSTLTADNAFHSLVTIHNGASSAITVDGTPVSSLNAGTNNFSGTNAAMICNSAFGPILTGSVAEIGSFGSFVTVTPTQTTNLFNNQHNYW